MTQGQASKASGQEAVLTAMADPTRRQLLAVLAGGGPATASALADGLPISRQAVTKHLAVLRRAGLVVSSRHGATCGSPSGPATWPTRPAGWPAWQPSGIPAWPPSCRSPKVPAARTDQGGAKLEFICFSDLPAYAGFSEDLPAASSAGCRSPRQSPLPEPAAHHGRP